MSDGTPDIGPVQPAPAPPPRCTRRWTIVLLLGFGLLLATLLGLWTLIGAVPVLPVSVTIHGEELLRDLDLAQMPAASRLLLAAGLMAAAFVTIVSVPFVLLFGSLALVLVFFIALGLPLLVVACVAALLLSPLLLLGWLAWKALAS